MKKLLLLFVGLMGIVCGLAQNNVLRGIVKLQSSGSKPLADVQISAFGAGSVYANSNGMFELVFQGKKPGAAISLLVQKDGYELINDKELENCVLRNDPDDLVLIVMAKQGERNKQALSYYNIIVGNTNNNYKQELKSIHSRLNALDEDDGSRQVLRSQINALQEEKEALLNRAEELAKQLASVDLDRASGLAQEAYKKFEQGDIKAALATLDDESLDQNYQEAQLEKAKLEERLIKADSALQQSIENYMIKARFCTSDRQFEAAYTYYLKAIEADSSQVKNLTEVGDYCNNLNQQKRAIRFYQMALKQATSTSQKVRLLLNLGHQFSYDNDFTKAKNAYTTALDLAIQLAKEDPDTYEADLASAYLAYGRMHLDLHHNAEAETAYLQSLEIRKRLALKNPESYTVGEAHVYRALGDMFSLQGKFSQAEAAFSKALTSYQQAAELQPGEHEPDLAAALSGMAVLQSRMKNYTKAEAAFLQAINIYEKLTKANPFQHEPNLATSEMNLAVMYYHVRDYQKAEAGYLKTIKIYQRLAAENPRRYEPSVAKTQLNLGSLYSSLSDFEKSEKVYAQSLAIRKRLARENPQRFDVAYCHILLNIAFMKRGIFYEKYDMTQQQKALDLLAEADSILDRYDASLPWVVRFRGDANRFKTYFVGVTKEDLLVQTEIDKVLPLEQSNYLETDLTVVLSNQQQIIDTLEMIRKTYPDNARLLARIAEAYGILAEYQLLAQLFKAAEQSAQKGLSFQKDQDWIKSYLALALLYQGKTAKAQKIYNKLKDQLYEGEPLRLIFLEDLEALENAGIEYKDSAKIKQLLTE